MKPRIRLYYSYSRLWVYGYVVHPYMQQTKTGWETNMPADYMFWQGTRTPATTKLEKAWQST